MPTLTNWFCSSAYSEDPTRYEPPNSSAIVLRGEVSDYPKQRFLLAFERAKIKDGTTMRVSRPVARDGDTVITQSGSRYDLKTPHPEYERRFPGAKDRLLNALPEAPSR